METKSLKKAAKEFNKVVILDTPVNLDSPTLEKDLYEALEYIEEGDEFSDATDAVFNELKIKYTPKPVEKEKKQDKKEKVKAGTTVEMEPDSNKIKKEKEMKKANADNPQVEAARLVLDRNTKKDQLVALLDDEALFDKKTKKKLLKETNFMSFRKQMKEALDADVVAEIEAEMKAAPKAEAKPKAEKSVKDDVVVNGIKSALTVKQLKKIAKDNEDVFNWKKLKKLEDFEDIQSAMLKQREGSGKKDKVKAVEPPKPKMIPNPILAEIAAFKKAKKLYKWAKETEIEGVTKKMKEMELPALVKAISALVPAEIEAIGKSKNGNKKDGERKIVNHIDQEARKARIIELVDEGTHTRKEIHAILKKEFPEEGNAHTNSNILSEMKSEAPYKDGFRWQRFGVGRLAKEDKNGFYVWADAVKKDKKKDKKNKK